MLNLNLLIDRNEVEKTELTKRLTIDGQSKIYPVYKFPLEYLYFNDQNGRINTAYYQYVANNGKLTPETGESNYNEKFENFIYESDKKALDKTRESIKNQGQQEPGVVLSDGRVVDGNRRFTAIRQLQKNSGKKEFFEAAILQYNIENRIDEKKIKQLELDLQLGREERKSYDPIDRIFDVYSTVKIGELLTIEEYKLASGAGNTKGINRDLRLAELIIKFLNIISPGGNPDKNFYIARELKVDGPIEEIEGTINKLKEDKEDITTNVLTILAVQIANSSNGNGDLTRKMREIKTNILKNPEVKSHFIEATDSHVDTIIDYFDENPVGKAQDLVPILENNPKVADAASKLIQSTNRLSNKGKKVATRRQSLNDLQDIRDNLKEISSEDFKDLKPEEFVEVKGILQEIRDLVYKLEH